MEAHAPYTPLAEFKRMFVGPQDFARADKVNQDPEAFLAGKEKMTSADFKLLSALYDAEIRYLDDQVGKLAAMIKHQSSNRNTMIIIMSDHGENLGDHGLMSHEYSVHDSLIRVPLIIEYSPGFTGGKKDERQHQTIDLFPTILHVTGTKLPSIVPGSDLALDKEQHFAFAEFNTTRVVERMVRRFPELKDAPFLLEVRDILAARTRDYKLYVDGGSHRYYKLSDGEDRELSEKDIPDQARSDLERALTTWWKQMGTMRKESKERMTPEEYQELKALNYIN